jgi:hypothetical protein
MTHDAADIRWSGEPIDAPLTRLDHALRSLVAPTAPDPVPLRHAVHEYVAGLRRDGATIEATVIHVKQALARIETGNADVLLLPERRRLAEQIVSWSIEAYYRAD